VSDLEGGAITLDESLRRFEAGVGLLRQCYQFLERAEQRIEQLVSLDAQGNITLAPFDATSTAEKQAKSVSKPGTRKSSRAKEPDAPPPTDNSPDEGDALGKLLF
jgi:exodeoxyribonuclease VII small subunit